MFVSEEDLKNIRPQVIARVAEKMNISFTTPKETLKKIRRNNQIVYKKMKLFIEAYKKWLKFNKDISDSKKLSKSDKDKLDKLSKGRDKTREELIEELNSL